MRTLSCALLAWALLYASAVAQSLTLSGPGGQTALLTAREIAALPRVQVVLDDHGRRRTLEGPLLIDVLARVGASRGTALRGPALANAVIVTASDGYVVVFGLAEADPGTRPNRMILADSEDGRPLGPEDGPFRIVVEGDLRPARSARMVRRIEVRPLAGASARN